MPSLGLIAGNGRFPFYVAQEARRRGSTVAAAAIPGETDPALSGHVDVFEWIELGQIKKTLKFFAEHGVTDAVMAGQVKHVQLFKNLKLDATAIRILATVPDRKTDTLLGAIADEFEKSGVRFQSSVAYLDHMLAGAGVLAGPVPDKELKAEAEFGLKTARDVAGLDIGQTVCVRGRAVVAVEAMEGTDACIRRAGEVSGPGFVAVKVAKPRQDVRFDVPVIGPGTLESLSASGARALVVEAKRTLLFERDAFLAGAEKAGITVLGAV